MQNLDGTPVPGSTSSAVLAATGDSTPLSNSVIITVTQGQVLTLVNANADTTYDNATITITRIA